MMRVKIKVKVVVNFSWPTAAYQSLGILHFPYQLLVHFCPCSSCRKKRRPALQVSWMGCNMAAAAALQQYCAVEELDVNNR
jgi:hypothetical protein